MKQVSRSEAIREAISSQRQSSVVQLSQRQQQDEESVAQQCINSSEDRYLAENYAQ